MNVCMFGDSFLPKRGGMEFVIHNLSNALVELGHSVTVVAGRVSWRPMKEARKYQLVRYGLPIRGAGRLGINHVSALLAFAISNRRDAFDVIHCHSSSFAGTRARRIKCMYKDLPLVMTPHGEDVQCVPEIGYGLRLDPSWDRRIRANLKSADIVTAISLSIENQLDFLDPARVKRVPNGVHTREFTSTRSQYLRKKLALDDDTIIFLSIGRYHIKKGYAYGIEAISLLVNKYGLKNIHYALVGRGVSVHKELVAQLEMDAYVSLIEEVPPAEVQQCYGSADVFFSPSIIEGLSLVSIEAISSALPLVVTDVPGNIDIVNDTRCGFVARAADPEHMAQQLARFMHTEVRREHSEKARDAASIYDWSSIAGQYLDVYTRAAQRVRQPKSTGQHDNRSL